MSASKWLANNISKHDKIDNASVSCDDHVDITRTDGSVIKIAVSGNDPLDHDDAKLLVAQKPDFIVVIPKDAVITGLAYSICRLYKIPVGGVGDLMRALNQDDISRYTNPDIGFVLRGLGQHTKVDHIEQLDNKRIRVVRKNLSNVDVLVINEYETTADLLRTLIHKHGRADVILNKNPNARTTGMAIGVSNDQDIPVLKWREFLGALNKRDIRG